MTDRSKIAAICRALAEKTVENGCTEAEALAAAEGLAKILEKHNLTFDEVQMREAPFTRQDQRHDDQVGERLWKIAASIATLTNTKTWNSPPGAPVKISFFGFEHEVAVAGYMLDICASAMRSEEGRLRAAKWPRVLRRGELLPFLDGMADRLAQRIREMVPPKPTGTGLVVLRGQLIDQGLKDAGIELETTSMRRSRDWGSYVDGVKAADRVALNRGVTGAGEMRRLR